MQRIPQDSMRHRAQIALGGNVGDVVVVMDAALEQLQQMQAVRVDAVSRVYETTPVGPQAGRAYLNAAASLETSLSPEELLDTLQQVERTLGRTAAERWGPRPIDLDLLLAGESIVESPRLTLPHPHLWYRRFVLDPLVEVAAEVVHPLLQSSITDLRLRLLDRPLAVCISGGCAEDRLAVGSLLQRAGLSLVAPTSIDDTPLQITFVDEMREPLAESRTVVLQDLPGSLLQAASAVAAAALDEPHVHSRPLRRIP